MTISSNLWHPSDLRKLAVQKCKKELPEMRQIGHCEIYLLKYLTDAIVYIYIYIWNNSLVTMFELFILEDRLIDCVVSPKLMHIRIKVCVYLS